MIKLGKDSAYYKVDSPLFTGLVKCKDLQTLLDHVDKCGDIKDFVELRAPKIPAELMAEVCATFAEFPHTETAFILYFSSAEGKWAVKCPQQSGSAASVDYHDDCEGMPKGYYPAGTIHTHPEMSAFWSGTDSADQRNKWGLHFVFGLRNGVVSQYKCTIFTDNDAYDKDWEEVCEPLDFTKLDKEPNKAWIEEINARRYSKPVSVYSVASHKTPTSGYSYIPGEGYSWGTGYSGYSQYSANNRAKRRGIYSRQTHIKSLDDYSGYDNEVFGEWGGAWNNWDIGYETTGKSTLDNRLKERANELISDLKLFDKMSILTDLMAVDTDVIPSISEIEDPDAQKYPARIAEDYVMTDNQTIYDIADNLDIPSFIDTIMDQLLTTQTEEVVAVLAKYDFKFNQAQFEKDYGVNAIKSDHDSDLSILDNLLNIIMVKDPINDTTFGVICDLLEDYCFTYEPSEQEEETAYD